MAIKTGDQVIVVKREVTAEDQKSGLYYAYFGGLTGRVDRVYPDGSVCVDVDLESLSEEARARHFAIQESEQQRWLESLSDDVRSRLTPEQKQLKMSYRILVAKEDLRLVSPDKSPKVEGSSSEGTARAKRETKTQPVQQGMRETESKTEPRSNKPRRLSEADLSAAEEAYLRSRRAGH